MNIERSKIIDDLIEEGFSHKQICSKLQIKSDILSYHLYYYKLKTSKHDKIILTDNQKQIILGSLLGDGGLDAIKDSNMNSLLRVNHCKKQENYSKYKISLLGSLVKSTHYIETFLKSTNKFYTSFRFITIAHPIFSEYRKEWYPNNRKIIPISVYDLNALGLAIWFMDDGSKASNSVVFYTDCFNNQDVLLLKDMLNKNFNIEVSIMQFNRLRVLQKSYNKFYNIIYPYMHKSMLYKLPKLKVN